MQGNNYQLGKEPILQIPIFNTQENKPIITLVDKILLTKAKNPKTDTSSLEKEIDVLVYKLYDLKPEEIEVVENSGKK